MADGAQSAAAWWGQHRRTFNVALVMAGLVAFAAYAGIISLRGRTDPSYEITLFTLAPQACGYVFAMALANVCYGLGPWCERRLRVPDAERERFRRWCFGAGLAFSVALPLLVPVIVWFHPA